MEHFLGSMLGGGKKIKQQKDWETAISATANAGHWSALTNHAPRTRWAVLTLFLFSECQHLMTNCIRNVAGKIFFSFCVQERSWEL